MFFNTSRSMALLFGRAGNFRADSTASTFAFSSLIVIVYNYGRLGVNCQAFFLEQIRIVANDNPIGLLIGNEIVSVHLRGSKNGGILNLASFTMDCDNIKVFECGDGHAVGCVSGNDIYKSVFFDYHTYNYDRYRVDSQV